MDGFKKDHQSLEVAEHSAQSQHHEEKKEAPAIAKMPSFSPVAVQAPSAGLYYHTTEGQGNGILKTSGNLGTDTFKRELRVISPRRLRDRELLKRKKEESREKDTYFEQTQARSKRPRQTRATGGRRRKQDKEPEPELEPQPEPESKNEPNHEHDQVTEPQHQPEPSIEPYHEDEQAAEPQHEPESKSDSEHKHEQALESQYEFEPENKLWIGHDIQQGFSQKEQEPLEHLEHHESPVITITEDETADEVYAEHEETDEHYQQDLAILIRDKEDLVVVEPEHDDSHEVLSFALQERTAPEQEEHQYYTPLL